VGKSWPRFLPEPTPEAIAHALIIEASAIIVDRLGEGHGDLFKAHRRAEVFARTYYGDDHLERALAACAAQPNNENVLLRYLMHLSAPLLPVTTSHDNSPPPQIRRSRGASPPPAQASFAANA
jgi:hypothetical protein